MKRPFIRNMKNESKGRSMVEMLGALAVIGVLSIGGIMGYKFAMDYYEANSIANEVNVMRTEAKVKIGQGVARLAMGGNYDQNQASSLSGGKGVINFNGYPVEYNCLAGDTPIDDCRDADGYHISLSFIPKGVCKTLATLLNGMDEKRVVTVNETPFTNASLCDAELNDVAVFFDAEPDLSGFAERDEKDPCSEENCDGYCVEGECVECIDNTDCGDLLCDQSTGSCVNCDSDADCGAEHCLDHSVCVQCLDNSHCGREVCDKVQHSCRQCIDDQECGTGRHCKSGSCVSCRDASDCDEGVACVNGFCSPTCTDASDCRSDEHCEQDACVKTCDSNASCPEDKPVCDKNTNSCQKCKADSECGTTDFDHCNLRDGVCVKCTIDAPVFNGTTCEPCPEGEVWDVETKACITKGCSSPYGMDGANCLCRENAHCKGLGFEKPYCFRGEAFMCNQEFSPDPAVQFHRGMCKDAADEGKSDTTTAPGYVISTENMNYWAAERFCESHGKERVKLKDICADPIPAGGFGYCHERAVGNTDYDPDNISKAVQALYNKGYTYAWVDDDFGDSCKAYFIGLCNGEVASHARSGNFYPALCK